MLIVVVITVSIVMVTMDDHNVVMILIMIAVMMVDDHDVAVILIMITMMKHDDLVITVPVAVVVSVADLHGYALFRNHHWLVAVRGRSQRRRAQDCERPCDKSQFVHVMFLHWVMLLACAVARPFVFRWRGKERQQAVICSFVIEDQQLQGRIDLRMNACSATSWGNLPARNGSGSAARHIMSAFARVFVAP